MSLIITFTKIRAGVIVGDQGRYCVHMKQYLTQMKISHLCYRIMHEHRRSQFHKIMRTDLLPKSMMSLYLSHHISSVNMWLRKSIVVFFQNQSALKVCLMTYIIFTFDASNARVHAKVIFDDRSNNTWHATGH